MIDVRMMARKLLLGGAYWSGASALARPLLAQAGAILMLHRVSATDTSPLGVNGHLSITPDFLDALIADLKARGHVFVSLDELLEALAKGKSANLVTITADDGWCDNASEALPVFEAHDTPFCVYVAPGLTDGAVAPWWEVIEEFVAQRDRVSFPTPQGTVELDAAGLAARRRAADRMLTVVQTDIPEAGQQAWLRQVGAVTASYRAADRFMSWRDIRRIAAHRLGMIGAHTVNHYNLKRLESAEALREMTESAAIIHAETGSRPRHFAYPYGGPAAAGRREAMLAKQAGFASAVTTRHGVLHKRHADHLHALPRVSVNGYYQSLVYTRALMSGLITPIANGGKRLVTV